MLIFNIHDLRLGTEVLDVGVEQVCPGRHSVQFSCPRYVKAQEDQIILAFYQGACA